MPDEDLQIEVNGESVPLSKLIASHLDLQNEIADLRDDTKRAMRKMASEEQ